jgi:hypothetical protein
MLQGVSSHVVIWDWIAHTNLLAALLQPETQAQVYGMKVYEHGDRRSYGSNVCEACCEVWSTDGSAALLMVDEGISTAPMTADLAGTYKRHLCRSPCVVFATFIEFEIVRNGRFRILYNATIQLGHVEHISEY